MDLTLFNTQPYDHDVFTRFAPEYGIELNLLTPRLNLDTVSLAAGQRAVCVFVNDIVDADVLCALAEGGTEMVALRCAGYNHVDLNAARNYGIRIARVDNYSPEAVAEYTVGLMLTLSRKIHRAWNRVKEGDFALQGLKGFNFHGRTVGVIGTGRIGMAAIRVLAGFGCQLLAYDVQPNPEAEDLGVEYVSLDELWQQSDIITLHCPLTEASHHLINPTTIAKMRPGVMLVNTSRGGLVDTKAVIDGLKSGHIGYLGIDVYEYEHPLLYTDHSNENILDDNLARLMGFNNVIITGHQGFFTEEAITQIAHTTLDNVRAFYRGTLTGQELV